MSAQLENGRVSLLLKAAVRSRDQASAFLDALEEELFRPPGAKAAVAHNLEKQPESVQMLLVLLWLWHDVQKDGIATFLDDRAAGAFLREAVRWCNKVGARESAAYLRAAAKLFPGGRVPKSVVARRKRVTKLSGSWPDRFAYLDDRYTGAIHEIPRGLKAWLQGHPHALDSWLSGEAVLIRKAKKPTAEAAARTHRTSASTQNRKVPRVVEKPQVSPPGDYEARFLDGLRVLSVDQWLIVADRYRKAERAIRAARETTVDEALAIAKDQRKPIGRTKAGFLASKLRLAQESTKVVNALPLEAKVGGKRILLRETAMLARLYAASAITVYPELLQTKRGANAAGKLLEPFAGLLPGLEPV